MKNKRVRAIYRTGLCITLISLFSSHAATAEDESMLSRAESGNSQAQFELARAYDTGSGVQRDPILALEWYTKAAVQGHPRAQFNLGFYYFEGIAIRQDYKMAFEWFSKAAEQGDPFAQGSLGGMYGRGLGVQKNPTLAWMWVDIGENCMADDDLSTQSDSPGDRRDRETLRRLDAQVKLNISLDMTENEVSHAEELSRKWLEEHGRHRSQDAAEANHYQTAQQLFSQGDYRTAMEKFESFVSSFPKSSNVENALYWKAHCAFNLGYYTLAADGFDTFCNRYPNSNKVPAAIHNQAVSYTQIGRKDDAVRLYQWLIVQHPNDPATKSAREGLLELKVIPNDGEGSEKHVVDGGHVTPSPIASGDPVNTNPFEGFAGGFARKRARNKTREAAPVHEIKYGPLEAKQASEEFVKQKLKAPGTAIFPSDIWDKNEWRSGFTSIDGKTRWTIVSWVDSQNGFGALIRTKYTCVFDEGNATWNLVSLHFDE